MEGLSNSQKLKLLVEEIEERAETFHKATKKFRYLFISLSVTAVFISALITVLAALNRPINDDRLSIAMVILGAIVTVVTAISAAYNPKETWLLYSNSTSKLRALQFDVKYKTTDPATLTKFDELDVLQGEFQKILREHSESYSKVRGLTKKD